MINKDINRAWKDIEENMKSSANVSLGQYEREKHEPRLMKNVKNF